MNWSNRSWILAVVAALLGFGLARVVRGNRAVPNSGAENSAVAVSAIRPSLPVPEAFSNALAAKGADQLPAIYDALGEASTNAELENLAQRLIANAANATSESLWALLFARWSEVDPVAMLAFVDAQQSHTSLAEMKRLAFLAWGAVDPEGASEAVRNRPAELRRAVLEGVAEASPERAVEIALKMPDSQFALRAVVQTGLLSDESLEYLLTRSVFDGSRKPLQQETVARLAESDPAAAIEYAQKVGRIYNDQVASAFKEVARHDVKAAIDLLETLPESRQRAISQVEIAKEWAVRDTDAAVQWARQSLPLEVRKSALLEIASVAGGKDPLAGLALVDEVGWGEVGRFYKMAIVRNGHKPSISDGERLDHSTSTTVASALLRQLAVNDPKAAREFVENASPVVRSALAAAIEIEISNQ